MQVWEGNEAGLNSQATRWLKVLAFVIFGAMAMYYFYQVLEIIGGLLEGGLVGLAVAMKNAGAVVDWHLYVLVTVVLVILAAIPLSLAAALFRMIGGHGEKDLSDVRLPATELGKVVIQILESWLERLKK